MITQQKQIIGIFIDGENLHYTLRELGWQIDYKKFYDYFLNKEGLSVYNAFYYTSKPFPRKKGRR